MVKQMLEFERVGFPSSHTNGSRVGKYSIYYTAMNTTRTGTVAEGEPISTARPESRRYVKLCRMLLELGMHLRVLCITNLACFILKFKFRLSPNTSCSVYDSHRLSYIHVLTISAKLN